MEKLNNITLEKGSAKSILHQISKQLGIEVETDCRRSRLALSREAGGGQLVVYSDLSGVDGIIFDLPGNVDLTIEQKGEFSDPVSFFSVCKGQLNVSTESEAFRISSLQSAIHGGFNTFKHSIRFQGEKGMLAMIIYVHKERFFSNMDCERLDIPEKLLAVVRDLETVSPHFLYSDIFHLPIIDAVTDIMDQQDVGLLNSTYAAAKMHEILFLQLDTYKSSTTRVGKRTVRRRERIQSIRDAEQILISRLKNPPVIPELAKMVGMNQQTLKQGFRQLFGTSINQHLNDKRLEQAGILIRAGELSIREVALEVGYNNPGYFSRRFREKYGVTPRYFSQAEG